MARLRFLIAWGAYAKGAIIEPVAMLRNQLLATRFYGSKVVEEIKDEPTMLGDKPAQTQKEISRDQRAKRKDRQSV